MPKSKDDSRRRYIAEPLARVTIIDGLASHFDFIEEVEAINADNNVMRIDAVATCRTSGWTFGWEFKKPHLFKSEFADAMRQGIHYRLSRITDARLPALKDMQLPAIALFPDWLGEHDDELRQGSRRNAPCGRSISRRHNAPIRGLQVRLHHGPIRVMAFVVGLDPKMRRASCSGNAG